MSKQILEKIDSKIDKIVDKVDIVDSKVDKLEVHVDRNTQDLSEHMKRTELNEHRIYRLEKIEQWLRGATWITLGLGGLVLAAIKLFK